jgi:outer membrane protein assembly complex protein YaeT
MKKRRMRLVLIVSALIAGLAVLAVLLLQTPQASGFAFKQLQRYLRDSGIDLQASDVRLDFFRGSARLDNVVVRSISKPGLPPFLRIKGVYADLSIRSVLRGFFDVSHLYLMEPEINYIVDRNGQTNLPAVSPGRGPGPGVLIEHGTVKDGSLQVSDLQSGVAADFPGWQISVEGDRPTLGHHIDFSSAQQSLFQYRGNTVPISALKISGELRRNKASIDFAQIAVAGSQMSLAGSLNDFSDPYLNLQLKLDLNLDRIVSVLRLDEPLQGSLEGTLSVTGKLEDIQVRAELQGTNFTAGEYTHTSFSVSSRAEWIRAPEQLFIHSMRLSSPHGNLQGTGEFFLEPGKGINSAKVAIQNFDLNPVWKLLNPPFDMASQGTGKIDLSWKNTFELPNISGVANLNLAATRSTPALSLLPISGKLEGRIHGGRIMADLHSVGVFRSRINGQLAFQSLRNIEGDVEGDTADTGSLLSQLSQFLGKPDESPLGIRVSGPMYVKARLSGKITQPHIEASADSPELEVGDVRDLGLNANAVADGPQVSFQGTIALPHGSKVYAQGDMGLRGPNPALKLNARTDLMPAASIASMLDSPVPVTGSLQAELQLDGNLERLEGVGSIVGDQLSVYQEPLGHLDAKFEISGKQIQSTEFRLQKNPQTPDKDYVDARFTYDLGSDQFSFQANGNDLTIANVDFPDGKPLRGTLTLAASGSGTVAEPSVDFSLNSRNTRLGEVSLGLISIDGVLRNQHLSVKSAAPLFNVSSSARIVVRAPYRFEAELQANHSDISVLNLKRRNGQPLTGVIDGTLSGSGNLKNLADSEASIQIRESQLNSGKLSVRTQGPVQAQYQSGSLEISRPAVFVSGNSILEIAGRVPLRTPAQAGLLSVKGQIDLAQANGFLPMHAGFGITGNLNVDLTLSGTPRNLDTDGTITLADSTLSLAGIPAPLRGLAVQSKMRGGSLFVENGDASWAGGKISFSGEFPFGMLQDLPVQFSGKQGPARVELDVSGLRPELAGVLPKGISGFISLHASASLPRMDLRLLRAQITFRDLSLKMNEIALSQKEPATIHVQDGIASISRFAVSGPETGFEASGYAGILPTSPLNLRLLGTFDAALLTFTNEDLKAAGKIQVKVLLGGTRNAPQLSGEAEMDRGRLSIRNPRVVADSLTVRLNLSPNRITIQQFTGTLNGGSVNAQGSIAYRRGAPVSIDLSARMQDVFLDFPEGVKSASSGTITITSSEDTILISGDVHVLESSYREPFEVTGQLMSYLRSRRVAEIGGIPNPLLDRIHLNIAVHTDTPLLVQNNIAKLEATANLRIVGTYAEPSVVGRINLGEGGEITLNQRTYYITRGAITLANRSRPEPELDIEALTTISEYDITLHLSGTPEKLQTTLTSEPSLPEPEIMSLLLTGNLSAQNQGKEIQAARTQALSLIAGQAGEEVAREARQAFHLSTVRFDPGLIASESDNPGARLTLGQDVTKGLSVAYSMNLANSADQIWAAQYQVTRRLVTQATKQADNSYRFEFRHDVRFGGPPGARTEARTRKFVIGTIDFHGGSPFSEQTLAEKFGVKPGSKYDFPKVEKGLDRLRDFYAREKRPEADVRLHRETQQNNVDLQININPGPAVDFTFGGMPVSSKTRQKVEQAWTSGVFSTERIDEAILAIRRPLIEEGYLQSEVTCKIDEQNGRKLVHFHITPGTRFTDVALESPGASKILPAELENAVNKAKLKPDLYSDPQKVADYLGSYYRERGYLQASVGLPEPELDPRTGTGRVLIPIREGPQFTIGNLEFTGNRAFSYDQLWSVIPTSSGSIYSARSLQDSTKALEDFYHKHGYNDASVTFRVVEDSKTSHANVTFDINEHRQSIVREIVIEGNRETSDSFVRRQLEFGVGDVLNLSKIDETRRLLYATGVYSLVDFQTETLPISTGNPLTKDVRVIIRLQEIRPYRLQYGLFLDTERGPGGIVEAIDRNFLDQGANLGLRLRYDSDLKEARLYFYQPFISRIHLKTDATAFAQRETRPAFSANRVGFSISRRKELPRGYLLDYGYQYDHVRWVGFPPDPTLFQASVPVARLIATVRRDTRDSFLNATKGEFTSHSLEFGPRWLGSETGFIRYFGQYFRYVPLEKFLGMPRKDEQGNPIPSRLVFASAIRLGLTSPFGGQSLVSPERFFAGGGTTMRGFQQDLLGPYVMVPDPSTNTLVKRPTGGEGLLLLNNEIRFPIYGILQGAGFADIGNVYPTLSDFNFSLRKSAGVGLRIIIRHIPLRVDYGFKLDRRPGEPLSAVFFSIGQAF